MKGSNCGLPVAAGLITVKVRKIKETRHSKGQNMVRRRVACLAENDLTVACPPHIT